MFDFVADFPIPVLYISATVIMSVVTFVAYGWDKRQAKLDGFRVPEKTLHVLALCCGWIGALIGQKYFRHKTIKLSFRVVLWAIVALHVILIVAWFYVVIGDWFSGSSSPTE